MNSNAKIILADNHQLFRESMKLLIENEGIGEVIGEAENGEVFLEMMQKLKPDLVLMDIEMPVINGIEASRKAIAQKPDLKILVLTMHGEENNFLALKKAGVKGFVLKSAGKKEIEKAIKSVIKGKNYF